MQYTLIHPFEFGGKKYSSVNLSDYLKARHKLAYADSQKQSDEEGEFTLLASFCDDVPRECIQEFSLDDLEFVKTHLEKVLGDFAKKKQKSPIRPVR